MTARKKLMEPVCNCPPNSPFLLACRRADPALVAALQNTERASRNSSAHVATERKKGNDLGYIPGMSAKSKPLPKPNAKELTAQVLKAARNGISIATPAQSARTRSILTRRAER